MRRQRVWIWLLAFAVGVMLSRPGAAWAAEPPTRVSVLTMGPGDHPFTRFGHNALLLEWSESGQSAVYNFGTFEFDGLDGVRDFMAGRFKYWLSVGSLQGTLRAYGAAGRSLTAQELQLSASERARLFTALAENARPEHRYYDYDYYRDNCSTRVRDVLDQVLDGQLEHEVKGRGRLSYRQHTLRLVADAPLLHFGLDVALGSPTDRAISRWEELFLPQELHDELSHATRLQGGQRVPLVSGERQLLSAARSPPSSKASGYASSIAAATLGLLLAAWGSAAGRSRRARWGFGTITSVLGLALGLLAIALIVFWSSKHWAAHDNRSLLACPPWALGLVVVGFSVTRDHERAWSALRLLVAACLAGSLSLLLWSLSGHARESLRVAAAFSLLWAGWLYGAWRGSRRSR